MSRPAVVYVVVTGHYVQGVTGLLSENPVHATYASANHAVHQDAKPWGGATPQERPEGEPDRYVTPMGPFYEIRPHVVVSEPPTF